MRIILLVVLLAAPMLAQTKPEPEPLPKGLEWLEVKPAKPSKEQAKQIKERQKQAERDAKQQRAIELATPPAMFVPGVKLDAVGQALTREMATHGFGVGAYEGAQQVFGMSTPHRVAFTRPVTDTAKQISLSLWCAMFYVGVAGQGRPSDFSEFVAFELAETPEGVRAFAKAGYFIPTVRGIVWKDETSNLTFRGFIEGVMGIAKDSLTPKEPPK